MAKGKVNFVSSCFATIPSGLDPIDFGNLLRLVGLPSEADRASSKCTPRAEELIRSVVGVIDVLVGRAMEARTPDEFSMVLREVFPKYFSAMRALGDLIRIIMPANDLERLMSDSLCELEADFRDLGPAAFGSDLSNRGTFTIWTLRKIKDLAQEISKSTPATDRVAEVESFSKFAVNAIWSRFHVDCLIRSMKTQSPLYPELRTPMVNGLRAAVDAYSWIRQAIDLRTATPEVEISRFPGTTKMKRY